MKIFVLLTSLLFPFLAFAQSVFINEIAWMGTPVAGVEEKQWWRYEWFELYNAGDTVGMLDGWTVELSREKIDFKVLLSGTISANGYFLVGASDKIPGIDLNYKNLGGKFFNGGQRVILKNNLGEIIDEVDATKGLPADEAGWPAGDNKTKQTMERKVGTVPTLQGEWQTSLNPGGTPKAQNSVGAVSQTKPGLVLKKAETKPGLVQDKIKKDLAGSSSLTSFQSHIPVVNPITLLAGLLALGFSGALLALKRSLALRQNSRQTSRQKHQNS